MMTPLKYVHALLGIDTFHNGGITGNGSVVGITDSGLDMAHDQFQQPQSVYNQFNLKARKVVYYETYADAKDQSDQTDRTCGHGTHVSGILAGNSMDSDALGVAPDAQIAFLDIAKDCILSTCASPIALTIPSTTDGLFQNQTKAGAKIISYSWGTMANSGLLASANLDYDDQTRAIDEYLYNHPEVLLIVAAGNAGGNGAKTILSPAGAKNVLTVGASIADATTLALYANDTQPSDCQDIINQDALALYSSLGPTSDGRLKPDLVVPGRFIVSARSFPPANFSTPGSNSSTCRLEGTSQATPLVSGMATLLHGWLRDGYWYNGTQNDNYKMTMIPSSLLKALLLHSSSSLIRRLPDYSSSSNCDDIKKAMYLFKQYPDTRQGYGRPNMTRLWNTKSTAPLVHFYPNHTGMVPSLTEGYVHDYSVTVAQSQRLRVTIVWTDPPRTKVSTSGALLGSDLDLSLILPDSQHVVYPLSTNGASRDPKNNVEMIDMSYEDLTNLAPRSSSANGQLSLTVRVTGYSLSNTQDYSIVSSAVLGAATVGKAPPKSADDSSSQIGTWVIYAGVIGGIILLLLLTFFCIVLCKRKRLENGEYEALQTTVRSMFTRHICPYCKYTTKDPVLLLAHVESAHATNVMESREILESQRTACPHCLFKSQDPVALVYHVQVMHSHDDNASNLSSARG